MAGKTAELVLRLIQQLQFNNNQVVCICATETHALRIAEDIKIAFAGAIDHLEPTKIVLVNGSSIQFLIPDPGLKGLHLTTDV